jgi:mycothiol synthase
VPLPRQATGRCGISITIRTFRWADLEALASLQSAIGGNSDPISSQDLRLWLEIPTVQPELNCFLAFDGETLAGYLQVFPEVPIDNIVANAGVLPSYRRRGIGRLLIERASNRGVELGVGTIQVSVQESAEDAQSFLTALGFKFVRRYQRMRRGPQPSADPANAPGVELSRLQEGDHQVLSVLQNASFATHFGFSPNDPDDIRHRLHLPGTSPEDVVAARKDGEVVAYCWTRVEDGKEGLTGAVWMTGVQPSHQGTGLGRIILRAGLQHMLAQNVRYIELEVDEENGSARHLYITEGFEDIHAILWYQKRIRDQTA